MLKKLFSSSPLHEHADAAQRLIAVAALPPDSPALVGLLTADADPVVRAAAAARCVDLAALIGALTAEGVPAVRTAISASLGTVLATTSNAPEARAFLVADDCTDALRAEVAGHTADEARRRIAIEGIGDETVLVDLALDADHAPVRLAAAERVRSPEGLARLAEGARNKDRGVARLARERLDAMARSAAQRASADSILTQAELLAAQPGPITTSAVELERGWNALDLGDDPARRARWVAVSLQLRQRFEREHEAQRAQTRFEQQLNDWVTSLQTTPEASALPTLRDALHALQSQAGERNDTAALERLSRAAHQIEAWEAAAPSLAAAQALVLEAELLMASTSIDDAQLPSRWLAIDPVARTAALTARFDAALTVVTERRQATIQAQSQHQGAARLQLHTLLHQAEQSLAAGQLQEARAAADQVRALKTAAGLLPKPTVQRLSRVVQQLSDLERWEKFGQETARVQLCERAEALAASMATAPLTPVALSREVQRLRAEWKKLDEPPAGMPKPVVPQALWERFDTLCTQAYAPAARHFAEQAAQQKLARKQREDFIATAASQVSTLLTEPRDWRAIERSLRETEATWRDGSLGSTDPGMWKKLDAKLTEALAPLRGALSATRVRAKGERQGLIAEAEALATKALERDTVNQVKALQARWQAHAKTISIPHRDDRMLWEKFRTACNAVFDARKNLRKEADERVHSQARAFEALCAQLEQLASGAEADEAQVRRAQRDLQGEWKKAIAASGAASSSLDGRFRAAGGAVDESLRGRKRAKEAAVWRALLEREQLCEALDAQVIAGSSIEAETMQQRWQALPPINGAWEKTLAARRDAALKASTEPAVRATVIKRIDAAVASRREALLRLELLLGLDSPAELQADRRALQLKQLRDRFNADATAVSGTADQILLDWCALPGVVEASDRSRCENIVAAIERPR